VSGAERLKSNAEFCDDFFDYSLGSDIFLLDGLLDHTFVCFPVFSIIVLASFIMAKLSQIASSDTGLLTNELEQLEEVILVKLTVITLFHLSQFGGFELFCNGFSFL